MILVTVGTHVDPFDRLVVAVERWSDEHEERVVLQRGSSRVSTPSCEARDWMSPDELAGHLDVARVVVCHAGPATLFEAWDRGHVPVVVPRDPAMGEHVDDHQIRFASRLGERARVLNPGGDLTALLSAELARQVSRRAPSEGLDSTNRQFVEGFSRTIDALISSDRGNRQRLGAVGQGGESTTREVRRWIRATLRCRSRGQTRTTWVSQCPNSPKEDSRR